MASIEFPCPCCRKIIKTPYGNVGKKARCAKCGHKFIVPDPLAGNKQFELSGFEQGDSEISPTSVAAVRNAKIKSKNLPVLLPLWGIFLLLVLVLIGLGVKAMMPNAVQSLAEVYEEWQQAPEEDALRRLRDDLKSEIDILENLSRAESARRQDHFADQELESAAREVRRQIRDDAAEGKSPLSEDDIQAKLPPDHRDQIAKDLAALESVRREVNELLQAMEADPLLESPPDRKSQVDTLEKKARRLLENIRKKRSHK